MARINCGCDDCEFWNDGDCEAEEIDIDEELTAAGFIQVCQTYKEY